MKRFLMSAALAVLLAGLVLPMPSLAQAASTAPQTYTVLVGYEDPQKGVEVMSFFPGEVTIHAGDTVHWVANSIEIHTVSFGYAANSALPDLLGPAATFGDPMPPAAPSPVAINPAGAVQTPKGGGLFTAQANSGLMGQQPGLVKTFDLTFPKVGDYLYVCLVHGWMMSGTIHVVKPNAAATSPQKAKATGQQEIAAALAQVPAVTQHATQQINPPTQNPNGTMTYHIMMGYNEGQIDLMQFFPDKIVVHPGDTVQWEMTPSSDAPHTVTFLNDTPAPDDFIPKVLKNGKVALYVAPKLLGPSQPSAVLTREGFYSSGVLMPIPGTTYSLPIGNMKPGLQPYRCLLHDDSGMIGTLIVGGAR